MEKAKHRPWVAHAGEVAWGLFLVNLILAGVAALMAPHLGRAVSFGFFLGVGMLVSLVLVAVLGAYYLLAIWFERLERD